MMTDGDRRIATLVTEFRAGSDVALEELKTLRARDALRTESLSAPNSALREYAISALSQLRHPDDLEFLLDRFREDDVQDTAQTCVEEDWGSAAVPALIRRLPQCNDDCLCLIEALEHLGDASALDALAEKLGDADQTTAEWAASAIAAIAKRDRAHGRAIALLERGSKLNLDPYVRETTEALVRELRAG